MRRGPFFPPVQIAGTAAETGQIRQAAEAAVLLCSRLLQNSLIPGRQYMYKQG